MRIWLSSVALASSVAVAGAAWGQQAKQDFTLVNKTGYALSEVCVSPNRSEEWEEDGVWRDVLEHGEAVDIHFERVAKTCLWDLKVMYQDDDSEAIWDEIDLCSVSRVTIIFNRKSDTTSATSD